MAQATCSLCRLTSFVNRSLYGKLCPHVRFGKVRPLHLPNGSKLPLVRCRPNTRLRMAHSKYSQSLSFASYEQAERARCNYCKIFQRANRLSGESSRAIISGDEQTDGQKHS